VNRGTPLDEAINVLMYSEQELCSTWSVAEKIVEKEKVSLSTP
jgi:hypothetical protein